MKTYYTQIKELSNHPELMQISHNNEIYYPIFLHADLSTTRQAVYQSNREHTHNLFHIVIYTEGKGKFLYNGYQQDITPGTLIISEPGISHDFTPIGCRATYAEITFEYSTQNNEKLLLPAHQLFSKINGNNYQKLNYPIIISKTGTSNLLILISKLINYLNENNRMRACISLAEIIAFCLENYYTKQSDILQPKSPLPLTKAYKYIQNNYTENFNIDYLAEIYGLSRGHFMRLFKSTYQTTPLQYQLQLRMHIARILLETTDLRCHEIASRLGYKDQYYFSKSFKKIYSIAPTAIRHNN